MGNNASPRPQGGLSPRRSHRRPGDQQSAPGKARRGLQRSRRRGGFRPGPVRRRRKRSHKSARSRPTVVRAHAVSRCGRMMVSSWHRSIIRRCRAEGVSSWPGVRAAWRYGMPRTEAEGWPEGLIETGAGAVGVTEQRRRVAGSGAGQGAAGAVGDEVAGGGHLPGVVVAQEGARPRCRRRRTNRRLRTAGRFQGHSWRRPHIRHGRQLWQEAALRGVRRRCSPAPVGVRRVAAAAPDGWSAGGVRRRWRRGRPVRLPSPDLIEACSQRRAEPASAGGWSPPARPREATPGTRGDRCDEDALLFWGQAAGR